MPGPAGSSIEGSSQTADAIQAFCRHLGELYDVLTAPYDSEALTRAASSQELQNTNCNVLLHNALYQWLGERVELSLNNEEEPEATTRQARESAMAKIQDQNMLSEFVQAVVNSCSNIEALAEAPFERGKQSLLFDLQGPIDLLGPEEVESLLSELANSDSPIAALETVSSDIHLLEDLCFGPTWPQLCDALGRLVCLPAAAAASASGQPGAPGSQPIQGPSLPHQQQLLMTVLQEMVSSSVASSPPHAAELLDALAPYLTALVLRLALTSGSSSNGGSAPILLTEAALLDPFAVGLTRIAHQLLTGLAVEYHILPPSCAALAARAVCDVVRAGLARGAPTPALGAAVSPGRGVASGLGILPKEDAVVDLSALDLLVLLDPELRWWQRLCCATHATQPLADAAAATQLAVALEAALEAWGSAALAAASNNSNHRHSGDESASVGRSPTHLVACTALLGGLVRANNVGLLAVEPLDGDGAANGLLLSALRPGFPAGSVSVVSQQRRLRLLRMLGSLITCFCIAADKPWLLRPTACAPAAAAEGAPHAIRSASVFLLLSAEVLTSAATLGLLSLLAPARASDNGSVINAAASSNSSTTSGVGGGGIALTPILQAMLRAAAMTATVTAGPVSQVSSITGTASEAEAWLAAAARILAAAAGHAALAGSGSGTTSTAEPAAGTTRHQWGQPAAADAMCALLRHVAGRVRGCGASAASTAPPWAVQVMHAAPLLAAGSPAVALALSDVYGILHAVLSVRGGVGRSGQWSSVSGLSSTTHTAGRRNACGGDGDGRTDSGGTPRFTLIDILDNGSRPVVEDRRKAIRESACVEIDLNDLELLAAEAVLSYFRADLTVCSSAVGNSTTPTSGLPAADSPQLLRQLPPELQSQVFLECAARRLCQEYDNAGRSAEGGGGGARSSCHNARGGLGIRCTAAKRRVARKADALARCCFPAEQALVGAGFARRVLDDVAFVLRSGEYESPYLEPLPYADPLAGLSAVLAIVLCWPGLLRLPNVEDREDDGAREEASKPAAGAAAGAAAAAPEVVGSVSLQGRHREEVLALLQELVTWLDSRGAEGGALPPADAAAVSLQAFSILVAAEPSAGMALERDTNIRWYLQNLCGTLPDEAKETGDGTVSSSHGRESVAQQRQTPQSDMLLDMARTVLQSIVQPAKAQ